MITTRYHLIATLPKFSYTLCVTTLFSFFFFNDPPPTEISPLPLPAALPISPGGEDLGLELLPRLDTVVVADLDDVAVRVEVCLLELAEPRRVQPAFFHAPEGDAHGLVAVLLGGSQPEHPAGPGLEHGDRGGRAVGVEQLGHAQLLGRQALHDLVCMLTQPGRLRP